MAMSVEFTPAQFRNCTCAFCKLETVLRMDTKAAMEVSRASLKSVNYEAKWRSNAGFLSIIAKSGLKIQHLAPS